tara:strand:- start:191 stop:838 length:648 start_codon:yes stop_codon:yes gene_type:complete
MNILFLGAPGCGKGTQSKIIIEKYKIPQISTGDLLRNEIQSKTDLGLQIKDIISSGKFVSDEIVLKLVSKKLDQDDCRGGFILDGYPRNIAQAESLDKLFNDKDLTLEYVFLIDVPSEILIQRCVGRLICDSCGWITNSFFDDKNEKEKCSKCNQGILLKREDDNEETIKKRLEVYREQTAPIIQFYDKKNILCSIDGQKKPSEISEDISIILKP